MTNELRQTVSSLCNEIEVMNFIIGSSQIHYGALVLTNNMEQGLKKHINVAEQLISTIKEDDEYIKDQILHDYTDDLEMFLRRVRSAISATESQRFIYQQIYG